MSDAFGEVRFVRKKDRRRMTIDKANLLIALRNRRFSLEREQLHPERIKEVTDIIDIIEAWQPDQPSSVSASVPAAVVPSSTLQ
jgi:hypothetical protein